MTSETPSAIGFAQLGGVAGQRGDDDGADERHDHHQGEQGQGVHWITHRAPRTVTTPVSIVRAYDRA